MPPREVAHRIVEAVRAARWRRDWRGWAAFDEIGDGQLADLRALRSRLRGVPLHRATYARTCVDRLMDGQFQFLGKDWPSIATGSARPAVPTAFWFHDPISGRAWPGAETSSFAIDVRSTGDGIGDVKYVWEANRLQFLHPVAAALAQGEADREAVIAILMSWMAANPPYRGVNWVSGIESALRIVSVTLVLAAVDPKALSPDQRIAIRRLVAAHARYLEAFPSLYSSANNHRVAEGLGLFLAGSLAPDLPEAGKWARLGRRILEEEAPRQLLADGVGAEQSPSYQAFTMELLAFAAQFANDQGEPLAGVVATRLAAGAEFLTWLMDDDGKVPSIGDDDEGRVLAQPPDREPRYAASVALAVSRLVGADHVAPMAHDTHLRDELIAGVPTGSPPRAKQGARVFATGGYTCAHDTIAGRRCHLVFDHGPLGLAPLAAHGHADALAVWLTIGNQPVFVDAGTYLYFSGRDTRTTLRESPAHNSLSVHGVSHSRANAGFGWSNQANANLLAFEPAAMWSVAASHDGYARPYGVRPQRAVRRSEAGYVIEDSLVGAREPLPVTVAFLCHPDLRCDVAARRIDIFSGSDELCRVVPPAAFKVDVVRDIAPQAETRALWSRNFGHIGSATRLLFAGMLGTEAISTAVDIIGEQPSAADRAQRERGGVLRGAEACR
jgi:uncharacterized heparinase superfamily protein